MTSTRLAATSAPSLAALAAGVVLLAAAPAALADGLQEVAAQAAPRWRPVVRAGYDVGLSSAGEIVLADGSVQRLGANGGLVLAAGLLHVLGEEGRVEVEATLGVKLNAVGTSASGLAYRAVTLEALAARVAGWLRWSAGLSLAMLPAYRGAGMASYLSQDLRPSLGLVAQLELRPPAEPGQGQGALGIRLLWQALGAEGGQSAAAASAIGLTCGVTF